MSCAPRSEIISSYICMYDLGASNRSVVGHVVPVAGHTYDNTVFVSSTRMHAVKKVVNGAMMRPGEGCWKPTISTSFIAPHGRREARMTPDSYNPYIQTRSTYIHTITLPRDTSEVFWRVGATRLQDNRKRACPSKIQSLTRGDNILRLTEKKQISPACLSSPSKLECWLDTPHALVEIKCV